jgi:hypothetical protein
MRQATNLQNFHPAMQLDGERFTYLGEIIDAGSDQFTRSPPAA